MKERLRLKMNEKNETRIINLLKTKNSAVKMKERKGKKRKENRERERERGNQQEKGERQRGSVILGLV